MRTLDVIEFVVAHRNGVTAQEIAGALNIPMSSLSYLLATLADRGYLRRDGRRYAPGPGLDRLRVSEASLPIEDRVAPLVRSIRRELNETASFMVRDGWEAKILVSEAAAQALRYAIEVGEKKPLHSLAGGKAILASMSERELDEYFAQVPREKYTDRTVVSEVDLRAQIADIRLNGFAVAIEESVPGISSMASRIMIGEDVVGAIGIAVPTIRFTDELRARARALLGRASLALANIE